MTLDPAKALFACPPLEGVVPPMRRMKRRKVSFVGSRG